MPEHVHVTMKGQDPSADLWRALLRFKQLSGYVLAQYDGAQWQGDFHDHIIRKDEDLAAHVRYSVNSPVRRGLVEN